MATFKSLLVGHQWVIAKRVRKCYHSKNHKIVMGDVVLEVKVKMAWHGYCKSCATEMIRNAIQELQTVGAQHP
jgi:hypothetical protein